MRYLAASMLALAVGDVAAGQALSIGATEFPRGELAFAASGTCVSAGGCGSGVLVLDASFQPVSRPQALIGHELTLVAIDLDATAEIRLRFDMPISNSAGGELYLAQAEFLGGLADPPGQRVKAVEIRPEGSATWCNIPPALFTRDDSAGTPTVFYSDPEIKSDAYRLWFAIVDLSSCGLAAGQTIGVVDVRGDARSLAELDLALVGNTNPAPAPIPSLQSSNARALAALLLAASAVRAASARRARQR